MKPLPLYRYIGFGGILEFLRLARAGRSIHGDGYVLDNINKFIKFIEDSDFIVTKETLYDLKKYKKKLEKTPDNQKLTQDEATELFKIMDKILFVVDAESKTKFVFTISEKRIDVNKLLFEINSLFAEGVFDILPDSIKIDFAECGNCIAFECSTASAFHILRGLEGLLRVLLKKLSPQTNVSQMNWRPLIRELRNLNIPDLSVLLDNLDRIRANYRNPTNHPEKIYNIEETQDLFNLCVGVVNDIVKYMKANQLI